MKISYIVANDASPEGWQEDYQDDGKFGSGTPEEIIGRVLDFFNSTLRPGEKPRRIVRIVSSEGEAAKHIIPHSWEKQNLVTINDKHGTYDKMKCRICGIAGKRFGLGPAVQLDWKFRRGHDSCTRYDL